MAGLMGEHKGEEGDNVEVGKIGDGWAVLLKTLEDFPYEKFGIEV